MNFYLNSLHSHLFRVFFGITNCKLEDEIPKSFLTYTVNKEVFLLPLFVFIRYLTEVHSFPNNRNQQAFGVKISSCQLYLSLWLRGLIFIFPVALPMWQHWYWAAGQIAPWSHICHYIDQHHFHCLNAREVYLLSVRFTTYFMNC